MSAVARKDDTTTCPAVTTAGDPHVGGPLLNASPVCLEVNGLPVIRVGDYGLCDKRDADDVVVEGAATFTVCGLPVARMGDGMVHGGTIAVGSPDVDAGGTAFSIPAVIVLSGSATWQSETIRDLYLISTTESGQELFQRLTDAGQTVTINEWTSTNGFCSPVNGADAQAGTPTGSSIDWNSGYRSNAFDDTGALIPQPPVVILFHEMTHALANSEGTHRYGTDPTPPTSEPGINEEEAQAIGTGSHDGEEPNENSFRDDLGLDRRDNHIGTGGPATGEPTPLDLRLGDC